VQENHLQVTAVLLPSPAGHSNHSQLSQHVAAGFTERTALSPALSLKSGRLNPKALKETVKSNEGHHRMTQPASI